MKHITKKDNTTLVLSYFKKNKAKLILENDNSDGLFSRLKAAWVFLIFAKVTTTITLDEQEIADIVDQLVKVQNLK
jgi:hypothetical protein